MIKSRLRDLKNEIRQMSENKKKKNERPDVIVILAEEILDFNRFYPPEESPRNIMPDLESEESAAQRINQRGHGLKI